MPLLSANVIICESVLVEKNTDVSSAIRILNVLTISPYALVASFRVLTMLSSAPGDFAIHVVQVQMRTAEGNAVVAAAPELPFVYGNRIDPSGPSAFNLTTEFTIDLVPLGALGTYMIWVILDGSSVTGTPLTLRRGQA
jgi:hypothetical protein